jgi:hypothetical protein
MFYSTGMTVSRAISSHSSLSVDYQYRTDLGQFGFFGRTKEHRLTMGFDYAVPVSRTRRASFHLDVSPDALLIPESVLDPAAPSGVYTRLYRLHGDANIQYEFRPNWRASVGYRRGAEYLAVFTRPVFSEAEYLGLTGLIGRRVDITASGGYATAASPLNLGQKIHTSTGDLRIRYALWREFALYTQYLYYRYDLRDQAVLALGLPNRLTQSAVRAGFMLFVTPLGK